ncbi:MAG: sigma 54-interacting transcriptional regulator [Firmicutes bacterium]|nr:sigma 54-interacting transcriptional regulator [Bacillota bacterium]
MQAKDIMEPISITLNASSTMRDALLAYRSTRLTGIPVVDDDGKLIGLFTRHNLYDCLLQGIGLDTAIEKYYLREITFFQEDKDFNQPAELIKWLRNSRIGQTPVIDQDGRPSGTITQAYAVIHLLDRIEFLYEELSNVFQQAPCGLVSTDENGIVNLVSVYLNRVLPEVRVGEQIQDLLPYLPFDEIINGVWTGPQKVKYAKATLIVNGLPIIHNGKTKGAILILQDAAEIEAAKHYIKYEDNTRGAALVNQLKRDDELFKLNGTKYTMECMIGNSAGIQAIKKQALQAAASSSTVLIYGESGTGKELLAQAIHNASGRFKRPFVKVNCVAIPTELAEAELFGYEGGAFTGALRHGKPGKFELADGGTIFLDEIGDMPLPVQSKLLRAIQEKEIERVGGVRTKKVDVRILAATNRNLYQLQKEGRFREDLYYRLKVLTITIPPLREHREDMALLLDYFLRKCQKESGKGIKGVTEEVNNFFHTYQWPGNIREMENLIERAVIYCHQDLIQMDDLGIDSWGQNQHYNYSQSAGLALAEAAKEAEKETISKALKITGGNKSKAAKLLGISRTTLYEKLRSAK